MESSLHYAELALLVACLEWLWCDLTDFIDSGHQNISGFPPNTWNLRDIA
jgi:hypothetical protein